MTEILCYADSYLKEFVATVTDTTAKGVVLDRTAFYPGGGGQPADSGLLSAGDDVYQVKKLSRSDGKLVHEIDGDMPPIGTQVHGVLDWGRRHQLMRTHTALHILCGVVWRDYGAKVTGGNMQPGYARMDFELENMSSDFAEKVEELINREVEASRDIVIGNYPRDEAFKIPDLIRTKINLLPAGIKEVRTIDITGLDMQADGGTHVANTTEVGRIRVVGHESKGRINKRLRIEIDL
jgi:misacylated tRNA(Ala) deacylase